MYKDNKIAYIFITPLLLFLIIFLIYPFINNIKDSLFIFSSGLDSNPDFAGFNNYIALMKRSQFLVALKNTGILMVLVILFQVGFALFLAILVSEIKFLQNFFKVSYFIPIIISATALGLMFLMFYEKDGGLFNQILAIFKVKPVTWFNLRDPKLYLYSMFAPVIWQYIGFYFVIFLTGLTTISDEQLEAAKIDGANAFQIAFKIKIPLLQNVIRVVLILAITGTLKVFDLPYVLNKLSNPDGQTFILGTFMYNIAYLRIDIGQAAAFAVILVILGVVLSGFVNFFFKQNEDI